MENQVIKELLQRKSVRVYTEQPIANEDKQLILKAAMEAPTAGNQQLYTILDITDQELKNKLAITCDNQPFIAKGAMVLIFCADCQKWYDAYLEGDCQPRKPAVGDLMLAVTDAVIAAQNAVTAAESLGIGSCYIGDVMENAEEMKKLLQLPQYVYPACMLVFGYPTKQQEERKKPERFRVSDLVCENGYQDKTGEQIREMFRGRTGVKTYEDWMEAFWKRKYESDFAKEMNRSMEVYLRDYTSERGGWN